MIKRESQKFYKNNHYYDHYIKSNSDKEQWELEGITDKKFDSKGNLIFKYTEFTSGNISIGSGIMGRTTTYKYDKRGNLIEENWRSLKSTLTKYDNKYDKNGNLVGYEETYKKFDNSITQNHESLVEKSIVTCEIELEHNENGMLTNSREIKFLNNGFIFDEKKIMISYNNSDEIIKKNIEKINKSEDGRIHNHEVEIYKFYYDDKGEKVEEQSIFLTTKKDKKPKFLNKIIKKHNEMVLFDRDNEPEQKYLYYFDENGLKIKEEHYLSGGIWSLTKYEYELNNDIQ